MGDTALDQFEVQLFSVLAGVFCVVSLLVRQFFKRAATSHRLLIDFEQHSPAPSLVTDHSGKITHRNVAAEALNPEGLESQTIENCLSNLVADPKSAIFRLKSQMDTQDWVTTQIHTRSHLVSVDARKLKTGGVYWRVKEKGHIRQSPTNSAGLTVSIGPNGTVLSASDQLIGILGQKPKNLKDFLEWKGANTSGPCFVRTQKGIRPHFCINREISVGRREISLFEIPAENQTSINPFGALPIPVLQLDGAGNILSVNSSAAGFLKESAPEGLPFHQLFEGVGRPVVGWVSEVRETKEGSGSLFARITADS